MRSPVQSWVPLLIEDIGDEALAGRMQVLFFVYGCGYRSGDDVALTGLQTDSCLSGMYRKAHPGPALSPH